MKTGLTPERQILTERVRSYEHFKSIPTALRPREKFASFGADALSDEELLALVLNSGSKHEDVLTLSQKVVKLFTALNRVPTKSELQRIKGIGPVRATQVQAIFALSKKLRKKRPDSVIFSSSNRIFEVFRDEFPDDVEEFHVLLLDTQLRMKGYKKVFKGTLDSITIHPREVFSYALEQSAHSIVLLHNHPSGNCEPSDADLQITRNFIKIGDMLGIPVLDHVIIGAQDFWSYAQDFGL